MIPVHEEGIVNVLLLNADNNYKAAFTGLQSTDYTVKELKKVDPNSEQFDFSFDDFDENKEIDKYVGVEEGGTIAVGDNNYKVSYETPDGDSEDDYTTYTEITNTRLANLTIWKVSSSDDELFLGGAEFQLYKSVTEATEGAVSLGNGKYGVLEATKTSSDEASSRGKLMFTDLNVGTYYLVETKAPKGYMLSSDFKKILIPAEGETQDFVIDIKIPNTPLFELPSTGGHGTYWYTLGGFALMMSAVLSWYKNKRKEVLGE